MNKAKENIVSPKTMGNILPAKDKTEAEQKSGSSEAYVPTNPKQDKTECEQRNESKIDHTVDWTECAPKSTASNLNDSEDVKGGISGVKVSKYDAANLERDLKRELFGTWSEKCEVMTASKIPVKDFHGYLGHLESAYEGFDEKTRENVASILLTDEPWDQKLVEWKYNNAEQTGARYCMMAFDRSPDMKFIDCMYIIYKMDFTINPNEIVKDVHKLLWRLFSWNLSGTEIKKNHHGTSGITILQNFFRLKALEGFYEKGLIEKINYVDIHGSVEEKTVEEGKK